MEAIAAAGCCTRMWLRFDQTITNLTSGDLGILVVVIRLGVSGLKKARVVYLVGLFEGKWQNEQWDLSRVEHLQMIGLLCNDGYVDVLFTCRECGFGSLGSWSYSKEWAWSLGQKMF